MQNCIFCQIIQKEAKADVLFEDENCLVFTPLDPISNGHVLLIPKVHYKDVFDIKGEALQALILIAKEFSSELIEKYGGTGVNLLHASGKDAQQSVFHFHLHIVPRYPDDGLDLWLRNKL